LRRAFISVFGAALVALGLGFSPPTTSPAGGAILKISPTVFSVGDVITGVPCKYTSSNGTFVCTLTISAPASAGKPLSWYAEDESDAGQGSGGIATFSPSQGSVKPGQAMKVTITTSDCGGVEAWFFFGNVSHAGVISVIYGCG
jgi:hypothetical protein